MSVLTSWKDNNAHDPLIKFKHRRLNSPETSDRRQSGPDDGAAGDAAGGDGGSPGGRGHGQTEGRGQTGGGHGAGLEGWGLGPPL